MKKFLNAFSFLTIIPVPGHKYADLPEAGKSSSFFPVVGLVLGLLIWGVFRLGEMIWPMPVIAVVSTALWVVLTGGLHIDGLADLADGIGGGWDIESRLRIMKDSAIGTYGAVAVIILLMMKTVLVYALAGVSAIPEDSEPGLPLIFSALVFIPAGGRCVQVLSIRIFASAKKEGFGIVFKNDVGNRDVIAAILVTLAVATAFWGLSGAALLAASILFMFVCGKWISVRLGGLNGDSYGAICELSELFLLIIISIIKPQFTGWLNPILDWIL
jgi:adenosylcobinamide-GDP ribazoletransferase